MTKKMRNMLKGAIAIASAIAGAGALTAFLLGVTIAYLPPLLSLPISVGIILFVSVAIAVISVDY